MFLTRDKDSLGMICLWIGVERKDLYLRSTTYKMGAGSNDGVWAVVDKCVPRIMEILEEDYVQVFEMGVPELGDIHKISRLSFKAEA